MPVTTGDVIGTITEVPPPIAGYVETDGSSSAELRSVRGSSGWPQHMLSAADPAEAYLWLMVRIGAIVLNVSDTHRAGEFWCQALGYAPAANPDFLVPIEAGAPRLHLDSTDRTHLDLWAEDEEEQLAEVERLQALGATRVEWDYPEGADFVVLADPDGNVFCVINTSA